MRRHVPTILLAALAVSPGGAATNRSPAMDHVANGTFDVALTPEGGADAPTPMMAIAKTFHGDLNGTGAGRMLAVRTPVEGSAGYVAIERVTATLNGHEGGFALQHSGTMDRGTASATITVVPDSGSGGLTGIRGAMTIRIDGGTHHYSFRYALPR